MISQRFPTAWADLSRARPRAADDLPIETVRMVATLLLVSYHVVGSDPAAGLGIGYPHPARVLADLLRDVRMPLFAFIAGLVFALKPLGPEGLGRFFTGKLRRLALPGATAIVATALASAVMGGQGVVEGPLWHLAVYPYMHYWFLTSILVIFAVYAPLDAVTRGRALLPALGASIGLSLMPWSPDPDILSVAGSVYLAPYFLAGAAYHRHREALATHIRPLAAVATLAVATGVALQLAALGVTGEIPFDRRDVQSLAAGLGICLLAISFLPASRHLDRFGPYSFTIYLYHVFGLAAGRLLFDALAIHDVTLNIVFGIMCGIGFPVLVHVLSERWAVTRVAVIGRRA